MTRDLTKAIAYVNGWADKIYPTWAYRYKADAISYEDRGAFSMIADLLEQGVTAKEVLIDLNKVPSALRRSVAVALDRWYDDTNREGQGGDLDFVDNAGSPLSGMLNDFPEQVLIGMWAVKPLPTPSTGSGGASKAELDAASPTIVLDGRGVDAPSHDTGRYITRVVATYNDGSTKDLT